MIHLERGTVKKAGLQDEMTKTGMRIEAKEPVSKDTIDIGKMFAERIGLDARGTDEMLDNAINAALWCTVKNITR